MEDQNGDKTSLWQFYDVILLDISTMPVRTLPADRRRRGRDLEGLRRTRASRRLTSPAEDLEEAAWTTRTSTSQWADGCEITAPILADTEGYGYAVEPERVWPVVMLIDRNMKVLVERVSPNDHAIREAIEDAL